MSVGEESPLLRVQTVLYNTDLGQVWRLQRGLDAAAQVALDSGLVAAVEWALGDSSPKPVLAESDADGLRAVSKSLVRVSYQFFGANLGSSGGQNRLAEGSGGEFIMVLNPDTYPAPRSLSELLEALHLPNVGIAEARQIPLEHPKAYDPITGDTSWASGCCMMIRRAHFEAIGGFDADSFLLHCDDVDLSWRMRTAGPRVVFVPSAAVFHDKRPTMTAAWPTPDAEQYYAVLGRLMLATRWGRPDIVQQTITGVDASGSQLARKALAEYRDRLQKGSLPVPLQDTSVAEFIDGEYAVHRF